MAAVFSLGAAIRAEVALAMAWMMDTDTGKPQRSAPYRERHVILASVPGFTLAPPGSATNDTFRGDASMRYPILIS